MLAAMHLKFGLPAFGVFTSYFIRILVAYLVCLALSRLCSQPHRRFLIWISFLFGAGVYWIFLLSARGFDGVAAESSALAPGHSVLSSSVALRSVNIPAMWSSDIEIAARVIAWGYAVGVAILVSRMLHKRIQLWLVFRRASPAPAELNHIFRDLCRRMEMRNCHVLTIPGLVSPATACTWHARVLVPDSIESYLDLAQLEDVLHHELVHVKRRDYLWGILSELVHCVVFFHPAIWLALQHLHRERELSCDAAVVRERRDRRPDYAECLTRLTRVQLAAERGLSTINFSTSGSFLSVRVRALLEEGRQPSWWKRGAALTAGLALMAAFAVLWPVFAVAIRYAPPAAISTSELKAPPSLVRRRLRRHRRTHTTTRRKLSAGAIPSRSENVPVITHLAASAADAPALPRVDTSASHGGAGSWRIANSSTNAGHTASPDPTVPSGPVWSESPPVPLPRSTATPSWEKTAIRVAAGIGGVVAHGGADGVDQEGNHFSTPSSLN